MTRSSRTHARAGRFRSRQLVTAFLLTALLPLTGLQADQITEEALQDEEEVVDMLPTLDRAASPDESMAPDQAEFVGNPANSMFGWWPEEDGNLAPLETGRPGIFLAGAGTGPKDIPEAVAQGSGAAGKVLSLLNQWGGAQNGT